MQFEGVTVLRNRNLWMAAKLKIVAKEVESYLGILLIASRGTTNIVILR